ncbi:MAG: class I SAM-dependent methyltransferase [Myxococcales bacterium]|nr:class I SAM-dependent methyltransferase [Myxococcales bacterium]MCB9625831.1 class I SAM-dependent methyltransferase [Sandaracinaceae bacterium]
MTEQGATRLLTARPLSGRVLILEPPDSGAIAQLRAAAPAEAELSAWTFDVRHAPFATLFENSALSATLDARFDVALVYLPKGKARQRLVLDLAARALLPGGELRVVGGKREGIRSIRGAVAERFEQTLEITSGAHAQCVVARAPVLRSVGNPLSMEAYASEASLPVPGEPLTCVWFPGVYGADKLDEGSALLLATLAPEFERGLWDGARRVLDVGCGSGVLGAFLARALRSRPLATEEVSVDLVDVDALAVCAARATLDRNGLTGSGVSVWGSDVYSAVRERYDAIVSNPPFHDGVGTSYDAAQRLIREAPTHLRPMGRLVLVANAFLPYRDALDAAFGAHRVLAETPRFRVYEGVRRS